ncbi:MAG: hypothetical protein GY696_30830, partial [Gammaproteobacteria bacterium]|nr:hypothetical protein [Gammaproteobacteria bacterium]
PRNNPPPPANPPQRQPNPNSSTLNILQHNTNGITSKIHEILHYMEKHDIKIGAIQETKLTGKSKQLKTPNYTFVRKDRGVNKGGGLAFLVHKDVTFNLEKTPVDLEQDPHLESLTISLPARNNTDPLYIRNLYIPPQSSCNQNYIPSVDKLFEDLGTSSLILGDVNAHHQMWHSEATEDARGL